MNLNKYKTEEVLDNEVANIFNDYILCNIVFGLHKYEIFSLLKNNKIDNEEYNKNILLCINKSYYFQQSIRFGVFSKENECFILTPLGKSIFKNIGFFIWLVGGYGKLISNGFEGSKKSLHEYRDGGYVAEGSDFANKIIGKDIMEEIEKISYTNIADIGCGNGYRLINLCISNPNTHGLGIDIDANATDLAKQNVRKEHLDERIKIELGNVLTTDRVFNDIDTVSCFMMLHDIFGRGKDKLKVLLSKFPNATKFIFADTTLSETKEFTGIFTSGFEYVHFLQSQKLFYLKEYLDVFRENKLELKVQKLLPLPNTYLFYLERV